MSTPQQSPGARHTATSSSTTPAQQAMTAMTPAQQALWQHTHMYLRQQQHFALAEAQHQHHRQQQALAAARSPVHLLGLEPYRLHALAQHTEGQAWAVAKGSSSAGAEAPAASIDRDATGVVETTQFIRRGEEGNDGTGLRGTSRTTSRDGQGPRYVYRDFSHLPDENAGGGHIVMNGLASAIGKGGGGGGGSSPARKSLGEVRSAKLPFKLEHMLSDPSLSSIVGWMPHGRAWKVLKPQQFAEQVLPRYFESSNYNSFIRIVNAWGFRRFSSGPDANAYYHELFLRGRPHLLSKMKRLPKKARKAPISKDDAPDFYALEAKISKEGPQSITGAGYVKGATVTSVGPTTTGLVSGASARHGNDGGIGPAATLLPPQQLTPPGMGIPWMNPLVQHSLWMYPQQAPMVMGTQGRAVPMTMMHASAAADVAADIAVATGVGNTAGALTRGQKVDANDDPTENGDPPNGGGKGKK